MEVKQTSVEHPKKQLNSISDKCVCAHILLHAQPKWNRLEKYSEIHRARFTIKIIKGNDYSLQKIKHSAVGMGHVSK